ncbi:MAG: 4,5-DOPA dioxygenase extradiol [Isosphaeraceae bacterium]
MTDGSREGAAASHMPALFVGHGNPMFAIESNAYTEGWRSLGQSLPRPVAILAVSAHWYVPGTGVTLNALPRTIHDFGGFPRSLFEVEYPAPGSPSLARRVQELLAPVPVRLDERWGLDHGTWSVLKHIYPDADVPVVQLAIDRNQPAAFHLDLGRRLAPLRKEGVLLLGSGNLVHNLQAYAWGQAQAEPYDWAVRFESRVREALEAGDQEILLEYDRLGRDALLSVPTPDHYWPLLYVAGAREANDRLSFPVQGVDGRSISMLAVQVGGT